jgi:uncharacterized protein YqeY
MNVIEQIDLDVSTSMRAGTSVRTGTLRLLKSSFKNEQIKVGHELSGDEALKVLQREAKQRRDSIDAYENADRKDLANIEQSELDIIATYLPQPLSSIELSNIVSEVISELGNPGIAEMGRVIGAVMTRVGVRADGGSVAKAVREHLA